MTEQLVSLKKVCPVCDKEFFVSITEDAYNRWQGGELIQNVFPNASASQREALISGVCSDECWDKLWSYEDD